MGMRAAGLIAVVSALALVLASCRSPTKVVLDLRTNLPCSSVKGTTVGAAADPLSAEASTPAAGSTACAAGGELGTLVVVPRTGDSTRVAVRAILGVTVVPSACKPPEYAGCVVERRSIAFVSHEELDIPIALDAECVGVPCDATTTCVKGRCVSADVSCDADNTCRVEGDTPPGTPPNVPPPIDGSADGGDADAQTDAPTDAPKDAPKDAVSSPDADGKIDCPGAPDDPCNVGGQCCFDALSGVGSCDACIIGQPRLACSGLRTCGLSAIGGYCCYSTVSKDAACSTSCADLYLCETSADCPPGLSLCNHGAASFPSGFFGRCAP
jgi:hypothetical protein